MIISQGKLNEIQKVFIQEVYIVFYYFDSPCSVE